MKKQIWKRGIALILAICMVFGLSNGVGPLWDVKAEETTTYTPWTFSSAGFDDGEYTGTSFSSVKDSGALVSIDKSLFSGYVTFEKAHSKTKSMWGWDASQLIFCTNGNDQAQVTAAIHFAVEKGTDEQTYLVLGMQNRLSSGAERHELTNLPVTLGEEIFLQVAFDYTASSTDTKSDGYPYTDLTLTISVNGNTQEVTIQTKQSTNNGRYQSVYFIGSEDAGIIARSVHDLATTITDGAVYEEEEQVAITTTAADGLVEKDLASVKVDGTVVTPSISADKKSATFTLSPKATAQTVEIVNKAGVSKTYSVTVKKPYTPWTFSSAGFADGEYTGSSYNSVKDGDNALVSIDKSQFSGYVTFEKAHSKTKNMWGWDASQLIFCTNGNDQAQVTAAIHFAVEKGTDNQTYLVLGMQNRLSAGAERHELTNLPVTLGEEIFLQVVFDYTASSTDQHTDGNYYKDLTLTISANGNTQTIEGIKTKQRTNNGSYQSVYFIGSEDAGITVRSVHDLETTITDGAVYEVEEQQVTIKTTATDGLVAKDLASVKVDGTEVNPSISTDQKSATFTISEKATAQRVEITNKMGVTKTYTVTVNDEASSGTGGSGEPGGSGDPVVPEVLDPTLTKITFEDFHEILDGEYDYKKNDMAVVGTYEKESLNGTYFSGYVTFKTPETDKAEDSADIRYASSASGWTAMRFWVKNDQLLIQDTKGRTNVYAFNPADVGLETFYGTKFKLGISVQFVEQDNDGENNDVKLGIWIDDVLAKNEYIYLKDHAGNLGKNMGIYSPASGRTVTVDSVENLVPIVPEVLDPTLTKITFDHFEIGDGTYSYNKDNISTKGQYEGTLDGVYFCGNVTYSATEGSDLRIGGKGEWSGLKFVIYKGNLVMEDASGKTAKYTFTPEKAGLESFYNTSFDLGVSIKYVDSDNDSEKDDVQIGVWVNGVLCKNEYIYLVDYAERMSNYMSIFCPKDTTLTVNSKKEFIPEIIPIQVDENLTKLTFSDFSIADGKYSFKKNDLAVKGSYPKSIDGIYFAGNIEFSAARGAEFRFGGKSGWSGLKLYMNKEGKLELQDASGKTDVYIFVPQKAGLEAFKDTKFQLGYSVRFVDMDNDGQKDDVELGVWFNDVLYKNEYIYLKDYATRMGSFMGVYSPKDTSYVILESIYIPLNFSIFGFTENWAEELKTYRGGASVGTSKVSEVASNSPKTGDSGWGSYALLASSAILIVIWTAAQKKRERNSLI